MSALALTAHGMAMHLSSVAPGFARQLIGYAHTLRAKESCAIAVTRVLR